MSRQTGGSAFAATLDEVQLTGSGDREGLGKRCHAELLAVVADEAHLAGPDAVVDPGVVCGYEVTSKVAGRERWRTQEASAITWAEPSGLGEEDGPGLGAPAGRSGRVGPGVVVLAGPTSHIGRRQARIAT